MGMKFIQQALNKSLKVHARAHTNLIKACLGPHG